jgi:gamma-glutamyltranspeptidase/glutathione hydrolase
MAPTFVFRDGKPWLILGTPGGPTIFTTVFQVIVNRIDFGYSLEDSVAHARFHHQWPPLRKDADPIVLERELVPAVHDPLAALGYAFQVRGKIGDVQAIEVSGRRPSGASDSRGNGRVIPE